MERMALFVLAASLSSPESFHGLKMAWKLVGMVFCLTSIGCASYDLVAVEADIHKQETRVSPDALAALTPGSRVEVTFHSTTQKRVFVGTVLHASAEGVALFNCDISHQIYVDGKSSGRSKVFNQHIPVQWVPIRSVTASRVLAPPPADYVAPQLDIDTNDKPF